jgi:hypothetical protein
LTVKETQKRNEGALVAVFSDMERKNQNEEERRKTASSEPKRSVSEETQRATISHSWVLSVRLGEICISELSVIMQNKSNFSAILMKTK